MLRAGGEEGRATTARPQRTDEGAGQGQGEKRPNARLDLGRSGLSQGPASTGRQGTPTPALLHSPVPGALAEELVSKQPPHPCASGAPDSKLPPRAAFPETSTALAPHLAGLLPQQAKRGCRRKQTQEEHGAGGTAPPAPAGPLRAAHAAPASEGGRHTAVM